MKNAEAKQAKLETPRVQMTCPVVISKGRGPQLYNNITFLTLTGSLLLGHAASRLKFIVGHQHCNCMTSFQTIAKKFCLPDDVAPNLVDGFLIGSHGMSLGIPETVETQTWRRLENTRFSLVIFRSNPQFRVDFPACNV